MLLEDSREMSMSWNYRVMKRTYPTGDTYGIYEVYYDDDGITRSWAEGVVGHECGSIEELRDDLEAQIGALGEPVLDYDDEDEEGNADAD